MTITNNPVANYITSSIAELRKVTWPTRNETITHAGLVVGITLGVALLFTVLDAGLNYGLDALLRLTN